jgi:hypothetical protein
VGHLILYPAGHQAGRPMDARAEVGQAWGRVSVLSVGTHRQGVTRAAVGIYWGQGRSMEEARAWGVRTAMGQQNKLPEHWEGHLPDREREVTLVLATGPSQETPIYTPAL